MTTVWITFQVEGFHCYPNAPEQVAYLRDRHRHIFHYRVEMEVGHNEREVEFHMLKTYCQNLFKDQVLEAEGKSCETLATELLAMLKGLYASIRATDNTFIKMRWMKIDVSEDGECGSSVTTEV